MWAESCVFRGSLAQTAPLGPCIHAEWQRMCVCLNSRMLAEAAMHFKEYVTTHCQVDIRRQFRRLSMVPKQRTNL